MTTSNYPSGKITDGTSLEKQKVLLYRASWCRKVVEGIGAGNERGSKSKRRERWRKAEREELKDEILNTNSTYAMKLQNNSELNN